MNARDEIYYEALSIPFVTMISIIARRRMFDLFMTEMRPTATTTILDIGASGVDNEPANMLEKLYSWPQRITCASLDVGEAISALGRGIHHVRIEPGTQLPFSDGQFDIVYSNAVLEHVGGAEERRRFLLEALRVGRRIFMLVPNHWFPVEHHTGIPVLHWWPRIFRSLVHKRSPYWADPSHLDFLSPALLRSEWPDAERKVAILYAGLPIGPFSSNLAIISADR